MIAPSDSAPGWRNPRARLRRVLRHLERGALAPDGLSSRWLYLARIGLQAGRQWAHNRCPDQAASLAFQTVLSIVPLTAVTLAILRATGSMDAQSSFVDFVSSAIIPVSRAEISTHLLAWSSNVKSTLGFVGLVGTVLLAFIMWNSLERMANLIWRSEKRRSTTQKFVVFYASATLGPFLLGTSLVYAAQAGLTSGFAGVAMSTTAIFAALLLANLFLPACRVRLLPALSGAIVSTLLFEVAKFGFSVYVIDFALERYAGIYGALAILPISLLWIYYCWLALLFGFEIAHAVQNLHLLERIDRRSPLSLENELTVRINGPLAARILVTIADAYARRDILCTRRSLENTYGLSTEAVGHLLSRLEERGFVMEIHEPRPGLVPGLPIDEIELEDILGLFREYDRVREGTPSHSPTAHLDVLLQELQDSTHHRLSGVTLDALLPERDHIQAAAEDVPPDATAPATPPDLVA